VILVMTDTIEIRGTIGTSVHDSVALDCCIGFVQVVHAGHMLLYLRCDDCALFVR
jgi:hypothetical protein